MAARRNAKEADGPARDAFRPGDSPFRRRWSWRTRWWVVVAGRAIAGVLRVLYATLRVRAVDPADAIGRLRRGERGIVVFWHDSLVLLPLLMTRVYPEARVAVMLSWHRDAEIAAQAIARFGIRAVRGSSTRGWFGALRGLLAAHARGDLLAVAPDGPRGPRHRAKEGVVQLARATGLLVVPVGAAARPARRLGSWDRLQLPWPFARVVYAIGAPIALAPGEETDEAVRRIQVALEDVGRAARAA